MYYEQWCDQPIYIPPLVAGLAFGSPNYLQMEIFGKSYQHMRLGLFATIISTIVQFRCAPDKKVAADKRQSFHAETGNSRTNH